MSDEDFRSAAALFTDGKYREAIRAYAVIGAVDGLATAERARAFNNISACYAALKDYANALKMAREVLELEPQNAKALGRAGTAEEGLRHYEEAANCFKQAAILDAANAAYAAGVQRCQALIEARRGVASAETKDAYYYKKSLEKGTEAMKTSTFAEAARHFSKAIDLFPSSGTSRERAMLLSNRSAAYFRAGRIEESADDGLEATKADNTYARGFFRFGAAKAKLKKFCDAYDALQRCVELDPQHTEARQLLAEVTPAAMDARKSTEERAREHAQHVATLAEQMREEHALQATTALPRAAPAARSSAYSYCNFCNATGHTRAECPLLRRKRARPM